MAQHETPWCFGLGNRYASFFFTKSGYFEEANYVRREVNQMNIHDVPKFATNYLCCFYATSCSIY